eukprot:COSAG04_NODE_1174_length_7930_cov_2.184651_8_plen_183_part_00
MAANGRRQDAPHRRLTALGSHLAQRRPQPLHPRPTSADDDPAAAAVFGRQCRLQVPLPGARFGAQLEGADLSSGPLRPEQARWLTDALWRHSVLFIPGQALGEDGRLEMLANYFGAPVPGPGQKPGESNVYEGSLLPQILRSVDSPNNGNSAAGWHAGPPPPLTTALLWPPFHRTARLLLQI